MGTVPGENRPPQGDWLLFPTKARGNQQTTKTETGACTKVTKA